MKEKYIQIIGLCLTTCGFVFITFLYLAEPRTFAEVATKGQVAIGTYQINQAEFEQGRAAFARDEFVAARAAFDRADPEKRDAATQFYAAYSFYRQGWGRLTNDDALFEQGLATVNRVIAIEPGFRSTDASLQMRTAAELKTELVEGLKITASDFNPLKLTRERK